MTKAQFYLVGGAVRDQLLGLTPKDIDYTVEADSFDAMRQAIYDLGGRIFVESPEFFTIRAHIPDLGACDYVLARKEGGYSDGRHPDEVEVGTLHDDLARRDFTVNAIARTMDGEIIDPFNGVGDLERKFLRCVGKPRDRFTEDALRALRAIRFSITKGFDISIDIVHALCSPWMPPLLASVSTERKREEMQKAFAHDTLKTMRLLCDLPPDFQAAVFGDDLWLKPTMEKR